MKGLPKNQNLLSYEAYKHVLDTHESVAGRVSTFQYRRIPGNGELHHELVRTDAERIGLSYLMVCLVFQVYFSPCLRTHRYRIHN